MEENLAENLSESFAQRITRLRQAQGLTQKQVALAVGVPVSTYKEWEYGRRVQGEEIYVKLSLVLDVHLRTLLTGEIQESRDILQSRLLQALEQIREIQRALLTL